MESNQILLGHVIDKLKEIPDSFIDCVMTSPPYWNLRDYKEADTIWDETEPCAHEFELEEKNEEGKVGETSILDKEQRQSRYEKHIKQGFCKKCTAWQGQLGSEPHPDLYVKHLCDIFDEIKRTLKGTGTVFVNIGDSYASKGFKDSYANVIPTRIKKEIKGWNPKNALNWNMIEIPEKSKCMIPAKFAIEMINRGWILRNEIIWHKSSVLPESVTDRFTNDFEMVYFFTKQKEYHFEQYKVPSRTTGIKRAGRNTFTVKNGTKKGFNLNTIKEPETEKNMRAVWTVRTGGCARASGEHIAAYSVALCKTPILCGCPEGGVVLDPFMGSGTTAVAAIQLGRNYLGIEINPNYKDAAEKRIKEIEDYFTNEDK